MKKIFAGLAIVVALFAALVVAGYFALHRPDLPHATLDAKYKSPASKFVDMGGGIELHYRDEGEALGRTVLLVHGFSASLHTWEPWVAQLKGQYRVVSLDLPGHGLTRTPKGYEPSPTAYAQLVEAFAEKLQLPRFTIVGSSMGGSIAWNYALMHPQQVEGLVLVAASGWPDARVDDPNAKEAPIFKLLRDPTLGPLMRDLDNRALVAQGLRASFADPALATDAMVDRFIDLSRAPNHRATLLAITLGYTAREIATPEAMATIKAPTLVMHGDRDNLVPVEGGRLFAKHIPGAKLIEYKNVGHIPQEEIAAQSGADLLAFLQTLPAPTPAVAGAPVAAPAAASSKPLEGVY